MLLYVALETKSAATEVTAQKTQTPIVAKLYRYEKHYVLTPKEFAFLSNSWCKHKKGYTTPLYKRFS